MTLKFFLLPLVVLHFVIVVRSRKHHLSIQHDTRKYIPLSSFGFYTGGKDNDLKFADKKHQFGLMVSLNSPIARYAACQHVRIQS